MDASNQIELVTVPSKLDLEVIPLGSPLTHLHRPRGHRMDEPMDRAPPVVHTRGHPSCRIVEGYSVALLGNVEDVA